MSDSFIYVKPSNDINKVKVKTEKIGDVELPTYAISNPDGKLVSLQQSAFGELSTSQLEPVVQLQFPYGVNSEIVSEHSNNGSLSVDSNRLKASTGAAANQSAMMFSNVPIKYNPGQGGLIRFTGVFTTGVIGSAQTIGIGDQGDGYFFGYDGADFGILRREAGKPEIRSLQITTASSTAENITITLDGYANTVAVTNSGNVTTTANEIVADTGWANLGSGWDVHAQGDTVVFRSFDTAAHDGAYSITATTAAGTYTQEIAAVAATDNWEKQTAWSDDKADDSGILPLMDWTKGNVFQIRYQWLGFGLISFYVENPSSGEWVLVHKIEYANANLVPSVRNPTLPLCLAAMNTTNTTDILLYTSSMAGFIEGKAAPAPIKHGTSRTLSISGVTVVPILSLHNQHVFQGEINRARIKLTYVSVTNESGKPAIIHFNVNPTLTDASFSALEPANSIMDVDIAATVLTGGDSQFSVALPSGAVQVIPIKELDFNIDPLTTFTIGGAQTASGTASVVTVAVNWEENF